MIVESSYSVPPSELLDILIDLDYLTARHQHFGGVDKPDVTTNGTMTQLRIPRQLPVDHFPAVARSFVGDGRIVQVDQWDTASSPLSGTWTAEMGKTPVDMTGTYEIRPDGDGSTYVVTATVKVNVPMFGAKIESEAVDYLTSLITAEQKFLTDWLADH
ncbi:MAG: DUF2505 domain-containing protein [Actinomycetes bacterium]